MSPWEKIELSEDDMPEDVTIIDFSDETIKAHRDVKETPVTKTTGKVVVEAARVRVRPSRCLRKSMTSSPR